MRRIRILVNLFLLISLVISGCNLPAAQNPANQTTPTNAELLVSEPTQQIPPTPAPTATPTPGLRIKQGEVQLTQGDFNAAIDTFKAAAANSNDTEVQAAALLGIGQAYYLMANYENAITTFKSLLFEMPENPSQTNAYYYLGRCLDAVGQPAEAAEAYQQYIDRSSGLLTDVIQTLRGDALFAAGQYSEAISAYQAAIQAINNRDTTQLQVKIGQAFALQGDTSNAVKQYLDIYNSTTNDFTKAQVNLLLGQIYLGLGETEQAYARFQDSVKNYPRSYDTYSGLVELVNNNQPVSELDRGLVDYFAGQYSLAAEAFSRYINSAPDHDGTAHYYRGLSMRALGDYEVALSEWRALIQDHPNDRFYSNAWDEIAYTQWAYLDRYDSAAKTLLDFVALTPTANEAPTYLYEAARILERGNNLLSAAQTWARLIDEYPASEFALPGLFLSGITLYRLTNYNDALVTFQRMLVLADSLTDQSAALLWIGKIHQILGDAESAKSYWEQASQKDPTGYYSERSIELLNNQPPFAPPAIYDLGINIPSEKAEAEEWLRTTFSVDPSTDLSSLDSLSDHPLYQRGYAYWELSMYIDARDTFEGLRKEIEYDPVLLYRFMNAMLDLDMVRPAIFASRQILSLAGMSDLATLDAPIYFNHVRFGIYYKDLVLSTSQDHNLHPLLLLSVIRQESFFESFIQSSAGARGLMQIMPATGQDLASKYGFPENFSPEDLDNPQVSIPMGSRYLANLRDLFDGNLYVALAAYNGGPGNASIWYALSGNDPDLFLETVRFGETRTYIKQIFEFSKLYNRFYQRQ